ncbi:MAG: hypothetical protein ACYTBJ_16380 [Planctomycetota bacterium]|jgi:hypothetical protein
MPDYSQFIVKPPPVSSAFGDFAREAQARQASQAQEALARAQAAESAERTRLKDPRFKEEKRSTKAKEEAEELRRKDAINKLVSGMLIKGATPGTAPNVAAAMQALGVPAGVGAPPGARLAPPQQVQPAAIPAPGMPLPTAMPAPSQVQVDEVPGTPEQQAEEVGKPTEVVVAPDTSIPPERQAAMEQQGQPVPSKMYVKTGTGIISVPLRGVPTQKQRSLMTQLAAAIDLRDSDRIGEISLEITGDPKAAMEFQLEFEKIQAAGERARYQAYWSGRGGKPKDLYAQSQKGKAEFERDSKKYGLLDIEKERRQYVYLYNLLNEKPPPLETAEQKEERGARHMQAVKTFIKQNESRISDSDVRLALQGLGGPLAKMRETIHYLKGETGLRDGVREQYKTMALEAMEILNERERPAIDRLERELELLEGSTTPAHAKGYASELSQYLSGRPTIEKRFEKNPEYNRLRDMKIDFGSGQGGVIYKHSAAGGGAPLPQTTGPVPKIQPSPETETISDEEARSAIQRGGRVTYDESMSAEDKKRVQDKMQRLSPPKKEAKPSPISEEETSRVEERADKLVKEKRSKFEALKRRSKQRREGKKR